MHGLLKGYKCIHCGLYKIIKQKIANSAINYFPFSFVCMSSHVIHLSRYMYIVTFYLPCNCTVHNFTV